MFDYFHRAKISDFEEKNWSEFDESEKLSNLEDYRLVLRPISVNYRRCLREYLANTDQLLDTELLDSFPKGMFKTQEVHDYLIKAICSSSVSEREKFFSHVLISNELKQELKKIVATSSTSCNPHATVNKNTDNTVRNAHVEANDEDFEKDNWEKFDYRERRCKLMLQGRKVQLMMDNYKRCLFEYLDNSTTCHELIEALPDNMLSLPEFQDRLKGFINRASDKERILLLYKLVNLKYGDRPNLRAGNCDLISVFNPENHKGETVEFWPVYLFLKCGLEEDEDLKYKYFIQAHHSFKRVGEIALDSWRGIGKHSTEALYLLFPRCSDSDQDSFQKFCDAKLIITNKDKEYHCDTYEKTKSVHCYKYRMVKEVLGVHYSKEVYDGKSRRGYVKYKWVTVDGCAHARSLLHDRYFRKNNSISSEKWTLFEFMGILNVPFYKIPRYTGDYKEFYINKLASEFNWLYKIKDRLICTKCQEQMRFDFEFSKKGENAEVDATKGSRGLFAAYMTTRAHCTHKEEPHDINVYFNHCVDCREVIDSRFCAIHDGKYYLCRSCGSGHPSKTVPGTICPYCGSNKMEYVGFWCFECQNCGNTIKVSYQTFYNNYKDINVGELASSKARSSGVFTYRKNCEDLYTINCETGIPEDDIIKKDPFEEVPFDE